MMWYRVPGQSTHLRFMGKVESCFLKVHVASLIRPLKVTQITNTYILMVSQMSVCHTMGYFQQILSGLFLSRRRRGLYKRHGTKTRRNESRKKNLWHIGMLSIIGTYM